VASGIRLSCLPHVTSFIVGLEVSGTRSMDIATILPTSEAVIKAVFVVDDFVASVLLIMRQCSS